MTKFTYLGVNLMPHFFIERPVFAWVVALFIVLTGVLSIPRLPVAQYPAVAPPGIIISVTYPGASPDIMNTSVVSLIEREISGVDNLLYFESSSDTTGSASITVTFKPGTDIKLAQMDLQNQIKIVAAGGQAKWHQRRGGQFRIFNDGGVEVHNRQV